MVSVTLIEASVVVTRSITQALEPCGAIVELDPQRGEAGFPSHFCYLRWL